MTLDANIERPALALPRQEHEGAASWWLGTTFTTDSAADGFAFCGYPFGSLERQNWIEGYASQAFNPELLNHQASVEADQQQGAMSQ